MGRAGGLRLGLGVSAGVLLLDTAGRLHVDRQLMDEMKAVEAVAAPREVLLVVDALTGQDAVNVAQLRGSLAGLTAEQIARVVIAYEPVWAIGTGEVATPDDAQEVCSAIRGRLAQLYSPEVADAVRVLYGGSVKSGNVASIMAGADVDGALVGGASLQAEEFAAICRYQQHLTT